MVLIGEKVIVQDAHRFGHHDLGHVILVRVRWDVFNLQRRGERYSPAQVEGLAREYRVGYPFPFFEFHQPNVTGTVTGLTGLILIPAADKGVLQGGSQGPEPIVELPLFFALIGRVFVDDGHIQPVVLTY